ncbi:phage major capsid protein [Streptomyces sp. ISL-94]|uniref:phage major capsid protein n=1 Tax=Streptomyces sp. ISL-94 TaxID=2819190 RepID=UPI001BE53D5D|nr:phage major capsid protein [Streptomyces sp. ISL-94]MBT2477641.1 phage major capsid protein [Streptomyces sp. ISL-94]
MPVKTDELTEELKHHLVAAREIAAKAEADNDRDFTDAERAQVAEHMAKAKEAKEGLEKAKATNTMRQALADLGDGVELNEKSGERRTPSGLVVPTTGKSLGEHFTESAEYAGLMSQAPRGGFGAKSRVQSLPVGYKSLVTGTSDTSAGAWVTNDYLGQRVGLDLFQRPLRLRDVVTNGTTTSDTVEYVRITSTTNNAAPVAEATSSAAPTAPASVPGALVNNAGGGYKPESALAAAKVTTPVRTIAHWIPITKRALSDASQIRTLIDSFLRYGLEEELEDQMIAGDGTGENFDGLGNVSGVQAQAWDTNALTTLRKAKTKVRTVGRSVANAYLLNPADLETVDLLQDNEGRFYFGGPAGVGSASVLWGLPVIETEAVPAGTGYVGDFRKAILWDREQASITVTDSHADFFIRNLVAILAEMRAAFGILQPSAFVEVDLTA